MGISEVLNMIPVPIIVLSKDSMIYDFNEPFVNWSGSNAYEFLDKHVSNLDIWVTQNDCDHLINQIDNAKSIRSEIKLKDASGKIRFCLINTNICIVNDENIIIVVIQDLTNQKQKEFEQQKLYLESQDSIKSLTKDVDMLTSMLINQRHNKNDIVPINNDKQEVIITDDKETGKKHIKINDCIVVLNEKELSVIKLIVQGKSSGEIASELYLAEGSIRNIITEIISKLMLKDKTQLAVFAIKNGIV